MKKYKNIIIAAILIVVVLAFSFWYGGDAPSLRGWQVAEDNLSTEASYFPTEKESVPEEKPSEEETKKEHEEKAEAYEESTVAEVKEAEVDKYLTEPVPEGKPLPIEPENAIITEKEYTCTLSVRCDTVLNNMSWLDEETVSIIPLDGIIFEETTVTFYEGESVFDVFLREMKKNKIHMEFTSVPMYNSAYIEGIGNLYEFDCGELSGWMYKVNGWFPNYGCSRYQLKDGDRIEWVYTCDLGRDVGGEYAARRN